MATVAFACNGNVQARPIHPHVKTTASAVTLQAGILKRVAPTAADGTSQLFVRGKLIATQRGGTTAFAVTLAMPDEEPQGIEIGNAQVVESKNSNGNNSDVLQTVEGNPSVVQNVIFPDSLTYSRGQMDGLWGACSVNVAETSTDGVKTVTLRRRITGHHPLDGLELAERYELYDGHDVIRKTVSVENNGRHWLKVHHMTLDRWQPLAAYAARSVALTPGHHGVTPSVMGYGNQALSRGVIAVSEVPSGLRYMDGQMQNGYSPDLFEWVIGPGERFEAEATWLYAFCGESYAVGPNVSTAMDRCVEGTYADFMREHVVRPSLDMADRMPVFCTWTNYNSHLNQENMTRAISLASHIGFRTFQFDAGWCDNDGQDGWACVTTRFDEHRFSDYKALLRQIRQGGMTLGVWFSVFRSMQSMDMASAASGFSYPLIVRGGGAGLSFASIGRKRYADEVVSVYRKYGARYMKQDLSDIVYGDIARGHESRTYKESLLRGLRGLLQTQDMIHAQAPDMTLQLSHEIYWKTAGPPADVAVLKHADVYHATPNEYWGAGDRTRQVSPAWPFRADSLAAALCHGAYRACANWYAHRGLPLYKIEIFGAAMTNFQGSLTPGMVDRQVCSWLMGAPTSFSGDLQSLTPELVERYRDRFAKVQELQRKYDIFHHFQYSGAPEPSEEDSFWWGKLNRQGEGAVIVMGGRDGKADNRVYIPWVQSRRNYRVKGLLTGTDHGIHAGRDLSREGLDLRLQPAQVEILELSLVP